MKEPLCWHPSVTAATPIAQLWATVIKPVDGVWKKTERLVLKKKKATGSGSQ
jgi:hypothetical protein